MQWIHINPWLSGRFSKSSICNAIDSLFARINKMPPLVETPKSLKLTGLLNWVYWIKDFAIPNYN